MASKLKIIPLGGLGEIGKNLTIYEYGKDMFLVDCGMGFPDQDLYGVDLVIPDISYLKANKNRIRGMVITHGHEDHIGAIPYVLKQLDMPIYATPLTAAIIELRLEEHDLLYHTQIFTKKPGDKFKLGCFEIEFIHTNHSIADSVALAIKTPIGTVIHTGDFKIDLTPIQGGMIDLPRLGQLGNEGVLALLSDSTNVERIHMTEETLLQMIREGNLEYRNVLDRLTGLELPVQFPAAGQFRRLKNALMIFCGQCTRAAIQGGMPQQTAFAMETEHCDRLERAATMTDLLTVNRRMMEDYIRKVHDLRATPDVSKPVQQCCDYIRRHILQPLELSQIARHVGYSEYYLSKRFNREMGIRVVDFIKDERINLAKIWLVTTSKSVDEISETLQFNSRNYFGKVFCEKVGMTPSAYRKQLRAQEEENQ